MPSKYSHSVVLADYSSRGVIFLPPDQRQTYKEHAPQPQRKLPRMRSSHTVGYVRRRDPEWDSPPPTKPYQSLSTSATPTRQYRTIPEIEDEYGNRQNRLSIHHGQFPHSTPVINVIQQSEPSAYQKQQQRQLGRRTPEPLTDRTSVGDALLSPKEETVHPKIRNLGSSQPPRSDSKVFVPTNETSLSRVDRSNLTTLATPVTKPLPKVDERRSMARVNEPEQPNMASTTSRMVESPENRAAVVSVLQSADPSKSTKQITSASTISQIVTNTNDNRKLNRALSNESKHSQDTAIWNPHPSAPLEPNFDGFADSLEEMGDYFGPPKQISTHSRDSSGGWNLPIQLPDSPGRVKAGNQHSGLNVTATTYKMSDQNTASSTKTSPTTNFSFDRGASSSISSVGSPNRTAQTASKKLETVNASHRSHDLPKTRELPKIFEDLNLSPSIFEDQEGGTNRLNLDFPDFGTQIGQISSGKDVSFNDDDAASELSAAMPPPISRFKDDEDEFAANMAKLFGTSNAATVKSGSKSVGRSAGKKGFFSKFRSKG